MSPAGCEEANPAAVVATTCGVLEHAINTARLPVQMINRFMVRFTPLRLTWCNGRTLWKS